MSKLEEALWQAFDGSLAVGDIAKHADHDQSTHGNWARGRVGSSSQGISIPDGYVVLSAAERKYLASLPEAFQGTLVERSPIYADWAPLYNYSETATFGEERTGVNPPDFLTAYQTDAGVVIDSAEPMDVGEYERGGDLARDIFEAGLVLPDGEVVTVKLATSGSMNSQVGARLDINSAEDHVGGGQRFIYLHTNPVSASNAGFQITPKYQGQGIGTTLIAHWEDQMAKAGIGEMTVQAVSGRGQNGGYTWLRYGYTPDKPFDIVLDSPLESVFFPSHSQIANIVSTLGVADEIKGKAADMAIANSPGSDVTVDFRPSDIRNQISAELSRRTSQLRKAIRSSEQAGSTLFTTADDVLMAPALIGYEYDSILTGEIPVEVNVTIRPQDIAFGDEVRTVTIGVSPKPFMADASTQEERFYDYLQNGDVSWHGRKATSELDIKPTERAVLVRADVIDRDGDGIIFEGTPFERRIGTASRQVAKSNAKKKLRGPAKPSSLSELARWWANNDPAAWEQDAPEVRASYRRFLNSKVRADGKLKKHADHDQTTHGNWAKGRKRVRLDQTGSLELIDKFNWKSKGMGTAQLTYEWLDAQGKPVFPAQPGVGTAIFTEKAGELPGKALVKDGRGRMKPVDITIKVPFVLEQWGLELTPEHKQFILGTLDKISPEFRPTHVELDATKNFGGGFYRHWQKDVFSENEIAVSIWSIPGLIDNPEFRQNFKDPERFAQMIGRSKDEASSIHLLIDTMQARDPERAFAELQKSLIHEAGHAAEARFWEKVPKSKDLGSFTARDRWRKLASQEWVDATRPFFDEHFQFIGNRDVAGAGRYRNGPEDEHYYVAATNRLGDTRLGDKLADRHYWEEGEEQDRRADSELFAEWFRFGVEGLPFPNGGIIDSTFGYLADVDAVIIDGDGDGFVLDGTDQERRA